MLVIDLTWFCVPVTKSLHFDLFLTVSQLLLHHQIVALSNEVLNIIWSMYEYLLI